MHEEERGIIPRVVDKVLQEKQLSPQSAVVTVQYIEIYNEEIRDLLRPEVLSTVRDARSRLTRREFK